MNNGQPIQRVAVLGAGVMGTQIAALLANAGIDVDLLDIPAAVDPAARARSGIEGALKSRPPAFFLAAMAERITPGSLDDSAKIAAADWVVEAIIEDMEAKKELFSRVEKAAPGEQIISSNTSGLSIGMMAQERSPQFRKNFLGIHFFNPPRYMKLVELIAGPDTDPALVVKMRQFLEQVLGKGTVVARDTPNFIGNRLGVFALMDVLHAMGEAQLEVETVDGLTGSLLGRPRSATLRLCDLIGLDTLVHVAGTAHKNLPADARRGVFAPPDFVQRMLERGLLGSKSGAGFYHKSAGGIEALDLETFEFRQQVRPELGELGKLARRGDLPSRLQGLAADSTPQGEFAFGHLCQVLSYAAVNAAEMAEDIAQIDRAMQWGFNWEAGPFEIWDMLGAENLSRRFERDGVVVPQLVRDLLDGSEGKFYQDKGGRRQFFALASTDYLDVVSRPGEELEKRVDCSGALVQNDEGFLIDLGDDVAALVFHGKMNVLGPQALQLVQQVVDRASFGALVLYGGGDLFSVGADLEYMVGLAAAGNFAELENYVGNFQNAVLALHYAPFPVVAAPRGLTLGGGCEFCLGADARVVAAELQIGLVETRVGLIPAGGGCKEMVRRQGRNIEQGFRTVLAGKFSDNAHQGRQWQLLDPEDEIVMNGDLLLLRAKQCAQAAIAGYEPPAAEMFGVAGDEEREKLEAWLQGEEKKGSFTAHDRTVGSALALVLCGGEGPARECSEQQLLDLEREVFLKLCGMELTQQRMAHMLKTGKPLRN